MLFSPFSARLEYEQRRDMDSRIAKLESSITSLENDLKHVQEKEADAKLAMEKATGDVDQLKDEVQGAISIHVLIQS